MGWGCGFVEGQWVEPEGMRGVHRAGVCKKSEGNLIIAYQDDKLVLLNYRSCTGHERYRFIIGTRRFIFLRGIFRYKSRGFVSLRGVNDRF